MVFTRLKDLTSDYKCYYHPESSAVGICDSCMRYVCAYDYKTYKKKSYGLLISNSSAYNYCIVCNANELKRDTKNTFYGFLLISFFVSIIFLSTAISYPVHLFTISVSFLSLIILLCIPLFFVYRNSQIAQKEFNQFKSGLPNNIRLQIM